jgi:prolyl 4-hydroxylase
MTTSIYTFQSNCNGDEFIKQIILFNCSKINKSPDDVHIEYYYENPICNDVKFAKNRLPLLSSVTLLNNAPNTLSVFTDISFEKYKYKKYTKINNNKIVVSSFEKNKHIIYNSTNAILFTSRELKDIPQVLFINIYDKDNTSTTTEGVSNFVELKSDKIAINNVFNFEFYESLLYQKNNDCVKFIWMVFDEGNHSTNIEFVDTYDIHAESTKKLKNKYGDVIQDIMEINNSTLKLNRFFQRFTVKNFMSKEICKWFIDETENYVSEHGWDTKNFENYITTDINLIKIKNIQEYFFKYELKKIMTLIEQSYCLPQGTHFDITDLNIIKYDNELIFGLKNHSDSSFITFNIALNSINEYEGGGTYFDDGITTKNDIGDILIHCGKINHMGIPIKTGLRYILVGLINIKYIA